MLLEVVFNMETVYDVNTLAVFLVGYFDLVKSFVSGY